MQSFINEAPVPFSLLNQVSWNRDAAQCWKDSGTKGLELQTSEL